MDEIVEREERGLAYIQIDRSVAGIIERLERYCEGEYADACEEWELTIRRHEGKEPRELDSFREFGADTVAVVKKHLDHEKDYVVLELKTPDSTHYLSFKIFHPRNEALEDKIGEKSFEGLATDKLVVVAENRSGEVTEGQRALLIDLVNN
jgi:septum formation topological specificity factor MinE